MSDKIYIPWQRKELRIDVEIFIEFPKHFGLPLDIDFQFIKASFQLIGGILLLNNLLTFTTFQKVLLPLKMVICDIYILF